MTTIDTVVQVNIRTAIVRPERTDFGVPLILAFHNNFPELVPHLFDPGFDGPHHGRLLDHGPGLFGGRSAFLAGKSCRHLQSGRRATAFTQAGNLIPTLTTEGLVYTVDIDGQAASYTVQALDGVAEIVDGLKLAIDALGLAITTVDNTTDLGFTADTAGDWFSFGGLNKELRLKDTTPDPGLTADLDAIELEDPDWYGLLLDSNSEAQVNAAAAWAEARTKLFIAETGDWDAKDPGETTDVMSDLQAANYTRSAAIWHGDSAEFGAAAWMGTMFTFTPGTATWALKSLSGVTVDNLNVNERTAIRNKNGNSLPISRASIALGKARLPRASTSTSFGSSTGSRTVSRRACWPSPWLRRRCPSLTRALKRIPGRFWPRSTKV